MHDLGIENTFADSESSTLGTFWMGFQSMLAFLVVFRTQQAYGRYIEGASLVRQMRSEWLNAASSLISFSSTARQLQEDVEGFQHLLVRLMSLLTCCALQSMSDTEHDCMPVIAMHGLDAECIAFLQSKSSRSQRSEIVMQWIQRLVVKNYEMGVLQIEAPILARFFNEISRGMTCVNQARNLTDIPFPFPYAQMLSVMLMIQTICSPLMASQLLQSEFWAPFLTFISVLAFWATNYTAVEIESPFGDDANDLPLVNIQADMNTSLWIQLESKTRMVPGFTFTPHIDRKWCIQLAGNPSVRRSLTTSVRRSSTGSSSRRSSTNTEMMRDADGELASSINLDSPERTGSVFASGADWLDSGVSETLRYGSNKSRSNVSNSSQGGAMNHVASLLSSIPGGSMAGSVMHRIGSLASSLVPEHYNPNPVLEEQHMDDLDSLGSASSGVSQYRVSCCSTDLVENSGAARSAENVTGSNLEPDPGAQVDSPKSESGVQEGLPAPPGAGVSKEKPWRGTGPSTPRDGDGPPVSYGGLRSVSGEVHNNDDLPPSTPRNML